MSAADSEALTSLRAVQETESEVEGQLARAKSDGEAKIQRLKEELEAALQTARAAALAAREATLAETRSRAEAEAAVLLAEGRKAAQLLELKAAQSVAGKREKVLGILLAEFRNGGGRP